ncbi:MAG: DNA polymerase IV [Candidatus Andersenbacteria bacterium]|nr:DNA polymerase IV [Candidatus Andersenbacteria bacterium]
MSSPYLTHSWPRAIVHLDGDSFFASVEQAVKPYLKGRPVVTGQERNIVAAASIEAKKLGITRGVALWDTKKMCPQLVVLPTDYETVSLFSKRLFDIVRRYTPAVEEYSVDEVFADLTGLRRLHRASYQTIAQRLQADVHRELGLTVSVGLSVSKVLAKIAAKKNKPAGFCAISMRDIDAALRGLPVEQIWNIGPNTAALLHHHGLSTALAFARAKSQLVASLLTKPGLAVWQELNGQSVLPVTTEPKTSYQTISKVKTFTPPSDDQPYVFAQLWKNLENACSKARRYRQAAQSLVVFLKRHDHRAFGLEAKLHRPSAFPNELSAVTRRLFTDLFRPHTRYRATGVILGNLTAAAPLQPTLFDNTVRLTQTRRLYAALDELRSRFGKHTVHHGASLLAQRTQHRTARGNIPIRRQLLLPGETKRRRLPLPMLTTPAA